MIRYSVVYAIGLVCAAVLLSLSAPPERVTGQAPGCDVVVDKTAGPDRVVLGDVAGITLTVRADCARQQVPIHAVLVVDNSLDMGGSRMAHMRDGVMAFVDALDLSASRVGIAAYHGTVEVLSELTGDRAALEAATGRFFPRGGSDLAMALGTAGQVLERGRGGVAGGDVLEVVIVLSGSEAEGEPAALIDLAAGLRRDGVLVVTVAGSGNADADTLEAMASSPALFYIEGQGSRYPSLFRQIARDVTEVRMTGARVTDVLPADMTYVWGSGIPAPRVTGDTLTWSYAVWPSEGITLTYEVEPSDLGRRPTNVSAEVELTFDRGAPVRVVFPVPVIDVVPEPTATQPPPTATVPPTATPVPRALFLPALFNHHCRPAKTPADVAVVLDASLSTLDRTAAGVVKLEAMQIGAIDLVGALNQPRDQVAVVVAPDAGGGRQGLTSTRTAAEIAIARAYPATRDERLAGAVEAALAELLGPSARSGARPVIVVVTDGFSDAASAQSAAAGARAAGADVYAAGVGDVIDRSGLAALSGDAARTAHSAGGEDLSELLTGVARAIGCALDAR